MLKGVDEVEIYYILYVFISLWLIIISYVRWQCITSSILYNYHNTHLSINVFIYLFLRLIPYSLCVRINIIPITKYETKINVNVGKTVLLFSLYLQTKQQTTLTIVYSLTWFLVSMLQSKHFALFSFDSNSLFTLLIYFVSLIRFNNKQHARFNEPWKK